tara:strand:- start:308 stop:1315 length:1008 start_codon:yes stop_codon:yes gene_type:complete
MVVSPKKVALLKGGWNSEREISLISAQGVLPALKKGGFTVLEIDVTRDIQALIQQLADFSPDVVFLNALHGQYVEDGMMQGLMEMLGYPYTGSDVVSSAIAFDKGRSRTLFEAHNVHIPKGYTLKSAGFFGQPQPDMPYPFVAKPLNEGSSVGVFIIQSLSDFKDAAQKWHYGETVLLEEYISGRELSIAFKGQKALGVLELCPKEGFYDYKAKYTDGLVEHVMPADLPKADYDSVMLMATQAVKALGVSGVSRVDMRFDEARPCGERAFVLEVNTLPGMTALSIVPEIAAYAGYDYETLCKWMVENPIWPQEKNLPQNRQDDGKAPKQKQRAHS